MLSKEETLYSNMYSSLKRAIIPFMDDDVILLFNYILLLLLYNYYFYKDLIYIILCMK